MIRPHTCAQHWEFPNARMGHFGGVHHHPPVREEMEVMGVMEMTHPAIQHAEDEQECGASNVL